MCEPNAILWRERWKLIVGGDGKKLGQLGFFFVVVVFVERRISGWVNLNFLIPECKNFQIGIIEISILSSKLGING